MHCCCFFMNCDGSQMFTIQEMSYTISVLLYKQESCITTKYLFIKKSYIYIYIYIYICVCAVKRLIANNRIQNKSFCLHNICMCT